MNAEIIAIGSELLTPRRIDTNSLYLTGQLNDLGVEVAGKAVIGDDRERLAATLDAAIKRSEIVILTGGLGPTEDDVTRDAVAQALGRPLVYHQEICDEIERRFRALRRGRMAAINKRQAYVIEGADVLANGRGTAPGLWIRTADGKVVLLLPGPPRELKPMFERDCLPRFRSLLPKQVIRTLEFRVAGMPESDLDQLISPVYKEYDNPVTTVLAAPGDIQIHLRARCATETEAEALLAEIGPRIETLLGNRIYSRNGDPLEAAVGKTLRRQGATLAVVESCTGGMLAGRITSVPGSSDYFVGGFLVYTNEMKRTLLGVAPALIEKHTAVSEPVAKAMADGARERTGADYVLSVTGVAGPPGDADPAPAGTVYIGLASAAECTVRRFRFIGERDRVRVQATQMALDTLRRAISRLSG